MVSFSSFTSSAVNLKNLTFSDQFPPFASSLRRKVVSRFGLGIVLLSFIILSVVLFNIYFESPFFHPVFQGFNRFGSDNNNSSFLSWPFFFSSVPAFSSALNDTSACNGSSIVQNSRYPAFVNETFKENAVRNAKSRDSLNSDGKDEVLGSTHVGTESEKFKDGSFVVGEGSVGVKTDGRNGSPADENPILRNACGKGMELENNAHVVNSSVNVKNESVGVKENAFEGKDGGGKTSLERISTGQKTGAPEDSNVGNSTYLNANNSFYEKCDIFNGEWVRDDTKPYYPPGSCPYIDRDFDCHLNGRPDNEFEKWRWQPYGCDIPRFNATDFLERLRGQKLVFVGDSLNRNMWESLVCLLRHSVQDKEQVYEISGRREFKKKGFYAFRFEDYNCSVDFVSSPFLVKESSFNAKNGSSETLRLDLMDETTSMYHDADVIIFNTGHWWTHEKTSRGEHYYQEGNYVHPRLKVMEAYKRALSTWAGWVDSNIDGSRTQVIFKGFSVTHFRGGPWNSGGHCHKQSEPIFNKTYLVKYPSKMKVFEQALQSMKTPVTYLNISRLTDYRKDGHPSVYRSDYQAAQQDIASVHVQDCSHWCLPGVPDTWNELLYASLLRNRRGSWRV